MGSVGEEVLRLLKLFCAALIRGVLVPDPDGVECISTRFCPPLGGAGGRISSRPFVLRLLSGDRLLCGIMPRPLLAIGIRKEELELLDCDLRFGEGEHGSTIPRTRRPSSSATPRFARSWS